MTAIPSTSTTSSTLASTAGTQADGNPKANLDASDFLNLFVKQLQYQNPMSPMDDNAMTQQFSALSSVQTLTALSATQTQMAASLASGNAINLIGHTVTWTDADGTAHVGAVEKVTNSGGKPSLTVAGTDGVDPSSITQVA